MVLLGWGKGFRGEWGGNAIILKYCYILKFEKRTCHIVTKMSYFGSYLIFISKLDRILKFAVLTFISGKINNLKARETFYCVN